MGTQIKKVSEIPGPKSKELLARRAAALPAGLGKSTEVVVEKAEGALVWDVDGNQLIDFAGGITQAIEKTKKYLKENKKDLKIIVDVFTAAHFV